MQIFFSKSKELRGQIINLALPVLIEYTFVNLMGMINAMMAGHISKEAAAAIGVVDTLNNIFISAFSSLAIGSTVAVAFYTGQNDLKNANVAAKQSIYTGTVLAAALALIIAVFRRPLMILLYGAAEPVVLANALNYLSITLFTYPVIALTSVAAGVLRGAGDTKNPAIIMALMNIINVCGSYLLIFGLNLPGTSLGFAGLGVRGAAFGIGIARISGAALLMYILIRGSLHLKIRQIFHYQPDFKIIKMILNIGIPASLETILFNTGKLVTQTFIVSVGTVAIVSNYVAQTVHNFLITPGSALGVAAVTLVGQNMGRKDFQTAEKSLTYIHKFSVLCMMTISLLLLPFFPLLVGLFTPIHAIIQTTVRLLRYNIWFLLIWPAAFVLPMGLKGGGDVRFTLLVSTASMWLFRITFGYILCVNCKLGVLGIWLGMFSDWIVRASAFYLRSKSGHWKKLLNNASPRENSRL